MQDLVRVIPPAERPVGLDEARAHLRLKGVAEDDLVDSLIEAVTARLDGYAGILGRCLVTQTWALHLDRFPACDVIRLPLPPLQSVASVEYVDPEGATQTLDPALCIVHPDPLGVIELASGASFPATACRRRAVTITFVAGYGGAAQVPGPIRSAALLTIGDLYANREGGEANRAAASLLRPYRVGLF